MGFSNIGRAKRGKKGKRGWKREIERKKVMIIWSINQHAKEWNSHRVKCLNIKHRVLNITLTLNWLKCYRPNRHAWFLWWIRLGWCNSCENYTDSTDFLIQLMSRRIIVILIKNFVFEKIKKHQIFTQWFSMHRFILLL